MPLRRLLTLTVATVLLATTAACSDGGGTTEVVVTRGAGNGDGGPPRDIPVVTGIPDADHLIDAALRKDDIELAGLTQYQNVPCVPGGGPAGPACRAGESEGDVVEALPASSCDDGWVRPENVPDAYRLALEPGDPKLLAVYRPAYPADEFGANAPAGPGHNGQVVAVFDTGLRDDGAPKGVALHMDPGKIVWLETDCAGLTTLLDPARAASYLIEPEGGAPANPTAAQ